MPDYKVKKKKKKKRRQSHMCVSSPPSPNPCYPVLFLRGNSAAPP